MANIQIPNLPVAVSLNGTEQLEAVQAGTSVRITPAQLALYAANAKLTLNNYAALRLNTYAASTIFLLGGQTVGDGSGGVFIYEASDTTSADNNGTIIVDANSRRWYRLYEGAIYTSWFGTKGNGVADDTTALQAAINFGLASNQDVVAPSGTYILSNTITFNPTADNRGFKFAGEYMGQDGNGTSFRLTASGETAIFQVNTNGHLIRHWQWADFRLETSLNHGATYGLLFNSTEYSAHMVRRVSIGAADGGTGGPNNAIGILAGTGANGEFIDFQDIYIDSVDMWFVSNATQAFQQRFNHVVGGLNAGGTYFYLNNTNGGFGLIVTDMQATSSQASGISNTTLFWDNGNSSVVKFSGGRVENLTQLYTTSDAGSGGSCVFEDMDVNIDYDPTNGALTVVAPVNNPRTGGNILFRGMQFSGLNTNCTFPVKGFGTFGGGNWRVLFRDCQFLQFARAPYGLLIGDGISQSLKFIDCSNTLNGVSNPVNQGGLFERRIVAQEFAVGARSVDSDSAWGMAGVPDNQITHPEIGSSYGGNVSPASPWSLVGAGNFGLNDWNNPLGGNGGPYDASPFARVMVLATSQALTQTISGIDLSSTTYARYSNSSQNYSRLTWVIFIRKITGAGNNAQAALTLSISDSVSGNVIDSVQLMAQNNNQATPVVLAAEYPKQGSTSHPIITFQNGTADQLTVEIDWQFFSTWTKPSFNPGVTASPATATQDVGGSFETLRAWSRFFLPYKSDTYGSAATVALPDLSSDIYMSSTDNTLTWYDGTKWNKLTGTGTFPKVTFLVGGTAPTTGFSITLAADTTILAPAGTLATGTIIMPAAPVNGQKLTVSSTQQVTALTVTPGGGQTMALAPTFLAKATPVSFIYDLANTTWYPT